MVRARLFAPPGVEPSLASPATMAGTAVSSAFCVPSGLSPTSALAFWITHGPT